MAAHCLVLPHFPPVAYEEDHVLPCLHSPSLFLLWQAFTARERKTQAEECLRLTQHLVPLLPQLLAKVSPTGDDNRDGGPQEGGQCRGDRPRSCSGQTQPQGRGSSAKFLLGPCGF